MFSVSLGKEVERAESSLGGDGTRQIGRLLTGGGFLAAGAATGFAALVAADLVDSLLSKLAGSSGKAFKWTSGLAIGFGLVEGTGFERIGSF